MKGLKYRLSETADGVCIVRNEDNRVMWNYSEAFRKFAEEHLATVNQVWEDEK